MLQTKPYGTSTGSKSTKRATSAMLDLCFFLDKLEDVPAIWTNGAIHLVAGVKRDVVETGSAAT
jgi:hypothetical protein